MNIDSVKKVIAGIGITDLRGPKSDDWVRVKGSSGAAVLLIAVRQAEDETEESLFNSASQKEETNQAKRPLADKVSGAMIPFVPVKGGCYQMGDRLGPNMNT